MQDTDIINLWKSYDRKLEETLQVNRQHTEDITSMKVRSFLVSMTPIKIFTILTGIAWVAFLDVVFIAALSTGSIFFLASAGFISLLNKLAIGIYLYQLILIHQVDVNEPIMAAQERIARLKSSTLWIARILFLQLPAWTTFYLSSHMLRSSGMLFSVVQFFITGLFAFLAVWLFANIRYENREKKWFRLIFMGREWTPLMKAIDLLTQIKESRADNKA